MVKNPQDHAVMVVDDEAFVRKAATFVLQRLGFEHVFSAESAVAALAQLAVAEPPVGLILCDLRMPDVDGVELIRRFDELGYQGDIILSSGVDDRTLSMAENLARARKLSVLGAISKPLRAEELEALLAKRGALPPKSARAPSRLVTPERLRGAIDAGELEPWYQPKIDVRSKAVVGVEALIRWPCKTEGMIFPDALIPVAEANGLMDAMTFALVERVIDMSAHWRESGLNLSVAINVSMDSLYELTFPDRLMALFGAEPNLAAMLQIEVTESRLMDDLVGPLDVLLRLRLKKISLSIDDFGTGHSNLSQLRDLPFDELKLDRSYVQGAAHNPKARAILESTVELAKKLGMTIVAEGVETREDWARIEQLGCDQVQGYFIARPMAGDDIPEWIADWKTRRLALFT